MIGLFAIDDDPELAKAQIAWLVEGVARTNQLLMLESVVPPIYSSGVLYRPEPWHGNAQSFSNVREIMLRGALDGKPWAECKALSAWLLASYRNAAPDPLTASRYTVDVGHRKYPPGAQPRGFKLQPGADGWTHLYHVRVALPDGSIEDPSLKVPKWGT